MADVKAVAGAKAAMNKNISVKGVIHIETTMTRPFIWIMKLRYIWAVIRARVGE